jgi:hypothetical protein
MIDTPQKNPRGFNPSMDNTLSELKSGEPSRTLAEQLSTVVDDLRQIRVSFGMRPYTVHSIRIRWDGGEIGKGEPITVSDLPIQPTPKIANENMRISSENAGGIERGTIRLIEISPRYTEDEIKFYFAQEKRVDEEGFIEIRIDSRDGITERDRYVVSNEPHRRPEKWDWTVQLQKQDANRKRDGSYRDKRRTVYGL